MGADVQISEAKRKSRLTAAQVKNLPPGEYHDGGGTGLLLRVDETGARLWTQRLMVRGKRREMGLGGYPTVTLAEARDAALENKRLAFRGGDPLAEGRKAKTLPQVARLKCKSPCTGGLRTRTCRVTSPPADTLWS